MPKKKKKAEGLIQLIEKKKQAQRIVNTPICPRAKKKRFRAKV